MPRVAAPAAGSSRPVGKGPLRMLRSGAARGDLAVSREIPL